MARTSTVLITGGTGFLGRRLVANLLAQKYRIFVLYRTKASLVRLPKAHGQNMVLFKYTGRNLAACFKKYPIDFVIHTATCYGRDNDTYADVIAANVLLPMQLLELSLAGTVKAFVNTDTFFTNDLGLDPKKKSYTKTKKLFLELATEAVQGTALRLINMRLQQMYGPGDNGHKFVMAMIKALIDGVPYLDLTPGEQKRDFIFVDDVAAAFGQVLKHYQNLRNFEEFDIGTGKSISIQQAVMAMKRAVKSQTELRWGALPYRVNEIFDSKAKLRPNKKINWYARTSFVQGLDLILKK